MKRFVTMWICSVLISPYLICQTVYPRKAVIDNDTVCVISIDQVKTLNKVFVDKDECFELRDSLYSQIDSYKQLAQVQKEVIDSQDKEIALQKSIVQEKNKIITEDEKMIKKAERKIRWLKFQRTILPVAGMIAGIVLTKTFIH